MVRLARRAGHAGRVIINRQRELQPFRTRRCLSGRVSGVALITAPKARNLAVSFSVPVGFAIGGGAIPTFIGAMGDAGSFANGFTFTGALIAIGGAVALLLKLPHTNERAG